MRTETLLGTYIPQMLAANIQYKKYTKNIARGTTDPEIDSVSWIELGNKYPMQIYILPNVHFWAHRTLKLTQLLV